MMNKSTTNRDIVECPEAGIVSRAELGSRVLVNGHFGGILRYLGPVGGRQGIFCGIELDQPLGKNDGTHQGVFYFDCRPSHGVFAPCHKVQLDGTGREKRTKRDQIREEPLSRSATAALGTASTTRNVQPPPSGASAADKPSSQSAAMEWSLMSTGSTNSGCSLTRFDDDLMAYSQATYAVFESDCQMLSDLEFTDSTLLRLEEDDDVWSSRFSGTRQPRPDESVILDGPTLGFDLPVIGSPEPSADETPTPMAERTDFVTGLRSQESKMEKTGREKEEEEQDKRNRNHLELDNLGRTDSEECPTAQQKHQHSPNNNEKARSPAGRRDRNNDAFNNNHNKTKAVTGILQEKTGKLIDRQQEEKKPKVSVFNSVPMPAQNLSAVARAKPKQPSKANIIMEQLKASIEAEKLRPKKEIRPKIQIGKEGTEESEREGGGEQTVEATSPTTEEMMHPKKNGQNTEAKPSVNKKPPSQQSTTTSTPATVNTHVSITLKKEKQRPTLSNNVSSSRSTSTASRSRLRQTPSATSSVSTPVHRPPAARQILSSRENTASTASAKTSTPGQQPTTAKSSTSSESVSTPSRTAVSKLGALFKGGRGNQPQKPVPKSIPPDNTKEELAKAREQLEKNRKLANVFIILSNHLSNQASTAERQIDVLQQLLEQKTAEFQLAMQKLEQNWQAKLQGTNAQHEHEIDQIRSQLLFAHKTEIGNIRQQHQAAIDELDRQLKLMKEEKEEQALKHEEELRASESERVRKLVNELESRNYELQLKGEELGKLRMENRALLLQADSIPEKDAQILKLGKKNDDLHESLNRVKQIERTLGTQLDHRKHEIEALRVKIMEIEKEKEILRYQLNDQSKQQIQPGQSFPNKIDLDGSIDASSAANVLVSSTPVSTRTPELCRKSTERPNSSCLSLGQNAAKIAEGDMSRSVDSALMSQSVLSCYRQEGHRAKLQNTPNKIYTPRDCYELNDPRPPAKRTVDFDLDTLEQVVNDSE